jgi:hypothetical protein
MNDMAGLSLSAFPYIHKVPKDLKGNLKYRRAILNAALVDHDVKQELWHRCKDDVLYFFNVVLWTYDPRRESSAVPFITYPFQDEAIATIVRFLGKEDVLLEKSRDMGASWIITGVIFHRWMFYDLESYLLGSRKEEYVDKTGDYKSLFGKFDFAIQHLPKWMVPKHNRNKLHLRNKTNGATVDGESTNTEFGRGDRRKAIMLDEFAAVDTGFQVEAATSATTDCRLYNSTPQGMNNAFYNKREKMIRFAKEQVIRLHWSTHPLKKIGLYTSDMVDRDNRVYELRIIDNQFEHPKDYKFILDGKLRSPWYDKQCLRAASQQEIAQELDIDYAKSGWQFFDNEIIDEIVARDAKMAIVEGELIYNAERPREKPKFVTQTGGRLKLWISLDINNDFPRSEAFVLGSDVATGTGGAKSSNSVTSVVGKESGQKIAEFAYNQIGPAEFADYTMAMGRYFHGTTEQQWGYLIWEDNGPGVQFRKQIMKREYPFFHHRTNERAYKNKSTKVPGWHSSKDSKRSLLGEYAEALRLGFMRNPSRPALEECREYTMDAGDIYHSAAKVLKEVDPTVSGENHGDRVIADALCVRGREDEQMIAFEAPKRELLPGSMAYRMELRSEREKNGAGDLIWTI